MNHRVGKVNQTTPLMKSYGKCFGCILLLPPVNLLRNAVLLSLNAYQSISKVNSKLQSGELRINLQWHKMERTELPISSQSPAFSLLPKCLYLVPLALIIFLFYICSFQEDQFGEKKKKARCVPGFMKGVIYSTGCGHLLRPVTAWTNKSMVMAAQNWGRWSPQELGTFLQEGSQLDYPLPALGQPR